MKYPAALSLLGFYCLTFHSGISDSKDYQSGNHDWDKLIFVHHWPASVCKMDGVACKNPPNYWTIHGLWPGRSAMCNKSWPFNVHEIEDLLPQMKNLWPDVLHPNHTDLWKHEWIKHGTCAATLSCLDSQHKYFATTLGLYNKTSLNSVLSKCGIVPSTKYYRMQDIRNAVENIYGVKAKIQCFPAHQSEAAQVLTQIEICFTKEFQPRDCNNTAEQAVPIISNQQESWDLIKDTLCVCNDSLPTYYPPIGQLWV